MHPAAEGYGYSTTGKVVDVSSRWRQEVEKEALFLLANMILCGTLRVELKIHAPKGGGVRPGQLIKSNANERDNSSFFRMDTPRDVSSRAAGELG